MVGFGPRIATGCVAMEQFWIPSRAIAACIGLLGFAVAVLSGLLSGAGSDQIMLRALMAMVCCIVLGRVILWATRLCLQEHMAEFESSHPVPDSSGATGGLRGIAEKNRADRAESAG